MIAIVTSVTVVSVSIVIVIIVGGCDDRDRDDRVHRDSDDRTARDCYECARDDCEHVDREDCRDDHNCKDLDRGDRSGPTVEFPSFPHVLCSQGVLDKSFGELSVAVACLVGLACLWVEFGSGPLPYFQRDASRET